MESEKRFMNQKLKLAFALAVGLLGGGILSHYLSPMPVFAQSQQPLRVTGPIALVTGQGTKVGDVDFNQSTIKLSTAVKIRMAKTDRTVTLEFGPAY
jgi:hypothetical protein